MRMTFGELVDQIDFGRIANLCPRKSDGTIDPRVTMLVNRAQSRMLARGDWIGSVQLIRLCITDGCITLPRQVERVDQAMMHGVALTVRNPWFQFVDPVGGHNHDGANYWGGWGPFTCQGANLLDKGYHATFRDVIPGQKKIRIYPDSPNDVGKEVLIQATDDNNQIIIESPAYNGFKMVLALPYVESNYFVSSIMAVIKQKTERNLNLYEVDTAHANSLRMLAIYEPGETTIELRRYQAPSSCGSCANQTFLALVKLKHIPVSLESDLLVIENLGAFEEMIRSLESKDKNQPQEANEAEANAVRELNLEKRNRSPVDQIAIQVRTMGSALPSKHGVGRFM